MPVYIHEEDAFEKMSQVEDSDLWLRMQGDGRFGDYSFKSFLDEWNRTCKGKEFVHDGGLSVNGAGAIYGDSGYNRYTVRVDGEIKMIEALAVSPKAALKAQEVGFRLFP